MPRDVTATGIKALQRADQDDRCMAYREMRRGLAKETPFTSDADQIEWVMDGGNLIPVAVLELTQRLQYEGGHDYGAEPPPSYFERIIHRYEIEGIQARMARELASLLGCRAYLVVFNDDASIFWVRNLTKSTPFIRINRDGYERGLLGLKRRALDGTRGMS